VFNYLTDAVGKTLTLVVFFIISKDLFHNIHPKRTHNTFKHDIVAMRVLNMPELFCLPPVQNDLLQLRVPSAGSGTL